jgi:hypothetical protein
MVYTKTINDSMIINFDYVYHHLLSTHIHVGTLWDPDVADVISAIMQILIVSLNFLKERCWLLRKLVFPWIH